jgi:hypothetical protein
LNKKKVTNDWKSSLGAGFWVAAGQLVYHQCISHKEWCQEYFLLWILEELLIATPMWV